MAKEQTDKSRYPSKYSPSQFVTATQYIIELACEQAALRQKENLSIQFWKSEKWRALYLGQLRAVNSLLTKYSPRAIIEVIKEKRIGNLRPKWVETLIKEKDALLEATLPDRVIVPSYEQNLPTFSRVNLDKKSNLDKLRDLDENT